MLFSGRTRSTRTAPAEAAFSFAAFAPGLASFLSATSRFSLSLSSLLAWNPSTANGHTILSISMIVGGDLATVRISRESVQSIITSVRDSSHAQASSDCMQKNKIKDQKLAGPPNADTKRELIQIT
jgi:hypothetical protein